MLQLSCEVSIVIAFLAVVWFCLRVQDTPMPRIPADFKHEYPMGSLEAGYAMYRQLNASPQYFSTPENVSRLMGDE